MDTHVRHHRTREKGHGVPVLAAKCWLIGTLGDVFSQRPSQETMSARFPQIWLVLRRCHFQIMLPSCECGFILRHCVRGFLGHEDCFRYDSHIFFFRSLEEKRDFNGLFYCL